MPNRFTTYLTLFPAGEGKVRLAYGHMSDGVGALAINGPAPVIPPDRTFSHAELNQWQFDLTHGTGFSFTNDWAFNPNARIPVIEVFKTIEETIPKGSVQAAFCWMQHPQSRERTFAVTVTNQWNEIPAFSLAVEFRYEANQPAELAPPALEMECSGGSEPCFKLVGPPIGLGSLIHNLPATFVFDPDFLPGVRSRAVAMSTESQWISLRTNGLEFDRIDGRVLAEFLETEPE